MRYKDILFYLKSYKFNSILLKDYILVLVLMMLPFLFTGGFYYNNTKHMLDNEIISENETQTEHIRDISDTMIKQAALIAAKVIGTNDVQMFMVNDWFGDFSNGKDTEFINYIKTLPIMYEQVDSIYIYSSYNDTVFSGYGKSRLKDHQDKSWLEIYNQINSNDMFIVPRAKNNIFPQLISVIRPVYVDNVKKGAVVINLDVKKMMAMLYSENEQKRKYLFILNRDGTVIASSDKSYFGKSAAEVDYLNKLEIGMNRVSRKQDIAGEQYITAMLPSTDFNITYVNATSMEIYADKLHNIMYFIIILLIALILMSMFIALVIAIKSFEPVQEIISVLDEPEKFVEDDNKHTGNLNELKYIIRNILKTLHSNAEMKQELENRLKLLDKSHFTMLQAQINPHFLYNTLETINYMALNLTENDENEVSSAVSELAELFRMSMQSTNYMVTISEELLQIELYINILKLRYGNMFSVQWDISPQIRKYAIVKLSLQPLVENAVYHGIKPKGEDGVVYIRGKMEEDKICFEIADNGVGMSEEACEELRRKMEDKYISNDHHIGILNVNQRLKIIFGDECSIELASQKGRGTTFYIRIPVVEL